MSFFSKLLPSLFDKREVIEAHEIVEGFAKEVFCKPELYIRLPSKELNEEEQERFSAKAQVYLNAILLFVVISEANKDPNWNKVRTVLENMILNMDRAYKYQVSEAMENFHDLLNNNGKELNWAKVWLSDIGIEDSNPVRLALFTKSIVDSLTRLRAIIQEVRPK